MNRNDLFTAFNAVDDDILERSETSGSKIIPIRRRLSVALIAAILALVLMGAGVVAIVYGDSIQSWFGHYWEQVTGQPMSDKHTALIDHLSQGIDLAQTVGDVTVTVDSATVGDDSFYLLLRIEGLELSKKHSYGLESYSKGQFFRRIWHSPFGLCLFPLFKRISAVYHAFLPLPKVVLVR